MDHFFEVYGYWVLIFAALIEGESFLLFAGGLAYFGKFDIGLVIGVSFLGAVLHDQGLFYLGRCFGPKILDRSEKMREKTKRVFSLMNRHQNWLIFGFRFIYGIRTVTPLTIGASQMDPKKYFFLTTLSAALWATAVCLGGYFGANFFMEMVEALDSVQKVLALVFGLLGVGMGIFWIWKKRKWSN